MLSQAASVDRQLLTVVILRLVVGSGRSGSKLVMGKVWVKEVLGTSDARGSREDNVLPLYRTSLILIV